MFELASAFTRTIPNWTFIMKFKPMGNMGCMTTMIACYTKCKPIRD